jgi:formylglycine-generating enzyme required for sulfatase activity
MKDGITNTLGMKFLPVKGTDVLFCIHETRYKDYAAYAAEAANVATNWKNQTYDGYALTENKEDHPVMSVSWEDAQAFCAWLSKKEGKTYRLPTDEEWSIAVGLGRKEKHGENITPAMLSQKENTEFPWGGDFPPKTKDKAGKDSDASRKAKAPNGAAEYLEDYNDGFPTTAPVMSFKPNKFGLYDLGGNVWEWCEDWYDNAKIDRVIRGGCSGNHYLGSLLSSARYHGLPDIRDRHQGFRLALVVSSSAP